MTNLHGDEIEPTVLTEFQIEVARLFFSLPASDRFLLAGGAALLVQHMTVRPTHDLDFFTDTPGSVQSARNEFEAAAQERGWTVDVRQSTTTFCRLVVHGWEDLLVDIALDSPPLQPATASFVGPTFAPDELAGRKLMALFDRAEARDFADVYVLLRTYTKSELLTWAKDIEPGSTLASSPSSWGPCADSGTATYLSKARPRSSCASSSTYGYTSSTHDGFELCPLESGLFVSPDSVAGPLTGLLTASTAGPNGTR